MLKKQRELEQQKAMVNYKYRSQMDPRKPKQKGDRGAQE